MDMRDLPDYLRMEGPHDLDYLPTASKEDAPPPIVESTDDEGDYRDVKSAPMKVGFEEGRDYSGSTGGEETREEEGPEEDPKEDPERDPSEGSQVGEEDPDDDSKVSEGQLMGSEDCGGDWSEGEVEKAGRISSEEDQEKERVRTILEDGQRGKLKIQKMRRSSLLKRRVGLRLLEFTGVEVTVDICVGYMFARRP